MESAKRQCQRRDCQLLSQGQDSVESYSAVEMQLRLVEFCYDSAPFAVLKGCIE